MANPNAMTDALRERFDRLLQDAIDSLPPAFRAVLEEVPVAAVDSPDAALLAQLRHEGVIGPTPTSAPGTPTSASTGGTSAAHQDGTSGDGTATDDDPWELLGLHSGVAITERRVEGPVELPETIHIFRQGVVRFAGGWEQEHADEAIYDEVRTTLLHEIGHHFGLDEDDLEGLGYA